MTYKLERIEMFFLAERSLIIALTTEQVNWVIVHSVLEYVQILLQ